MNPSVIEIVAAAARLGVGLQLRNGNIISAEKHLLPPSLRRRIVEHKAELVALLGSERLPECPARAPVGPSKTSGSRDGGASAGSAGDQHGHSWDIAPPPVLANVGNDRPRWPCRGCGSVTFWSAAETLPWVCQGCHATDEHPDRVRWHVVGDARRVVDGVRRGVGCAACSYTGFETLPGGRWTVCYCNDGFEQRIAPSLAARQDEGGVA